MNQIEQDILFGNKLSSINDILKLNEAIDVSADAEPNGKAKDPSNITKDPKEQAKENMTAEHDNSLDKLAKLKQQLAAAELAYKTKPSVKNRDAIDYLKTQLAAVNNKRRQAFSNLKKVKNLTETTKTVNPVVQNAEKQHELAQNHLDNAKTVAEKIKSSADVKADHIVQTAQTKVDQTAKTLQIVQNNAKPAQQAAQSKTNTTVSSVEEAYSILEDRGYIPQADDFETISEAEHIIVNPNQRWAHTSEKYMKRNQDYRADNLDKIHGKQEAHTENKVAAQRYSQMLYNGISGDALKYFLDGEINNNNSGEIEIAKKMKDDPTVQAVIKKIQFILKRAARGTITDANYIDLKVQKSTFRQLFYKYQKENS
jgi:hypothetical protein